METGSNGRSLPPVGEIVTGANEELENVEEVPEGWDTHTVTDQVWKQGEKL